MEKRRAFHRAYYRMRAQDPEYRAVRRAQRAVYRAAHRAEHNERERRRYWNDPDRMREKRRARIYGMSRAEYQALLQRQRGACAICKRAFDREPCVDHCHATGKVRGLLCRKCNMGLGLYDENPDVIRAALAYIEQARGDT